MIEKTVKRYVCEHCRKGMFKKPSMLRHEFTCTRNPKRLCGLCESPTDTFDYARIGRELKQRPDVFQHEDATGYELDFFQVKERAAIEWLYQKVDGCPCCVLAVLHQSKVFAFEHFDYKKEVAEWNREQAPVLFVSE